MFPGVNPVSVARATVHTPVEVVPLFPVRWVMARVSVVRAVLLNVLSAKS